MSKWTQVLLGVLLGCSCPLCAQTKADTAVNPADSYFQEALRYKFNGDYAAAFDLLRQSVQYDATQAAACYELAGFYLALNQKSTAFHYYQKACELEPDNEWYALQLAGLCRENNLLDKASELLEKVASEHPDRYELYYHVAELYFQQEDYKAALDALEHLEANTGVIEEITRQKCEAYQALGKPRKVIKEVKRLEALNPSEPHYQLLVGVSYLDIGKQKKAVRILDEVLESYPDNGEAILQRAFADYFIAGNKTEAMASRMKEIIDRPKVDLLSKMTALDYFTKNNYQDTTLMDEIYTELLEQFPDEYNLRQQHLAWLFQQDRKYEARLELRTVLDMNPAQQQAWRDYLTLYLETDDVEQVAQICREALDYFPDDPSFWYYLAVTHIRNSEYAEAIDAYEKSLAADQESNPEWQSSILGYMGDVYQELQDSAKAVESYEKALALNPQNVPVLNNYAYFLSVKGIDLERAAEMSRLSLRAEPNNSTYLDTYAWICFRQGNYPMAKIYIDRAFINLNEGTAEIYEHCGDILWHCGQQEAALLEWMKAVDMSENPSELLTRKVADQCYYER